MPATGIRTLLTRAAVVAGVPALIAACGQQQQGPAAAAAATHRASSAAASAAPSASASAAAAGTSCAGPTPAAKAGGTLTLGAGDNGKTLCVRTGTAVLVFLHGSATSRWTPVRVSSADLAPHPNTSFMLALGVTGGSYLAVRPGTVIITSSRPACGPVPQPTGPVTSGGKHCPSVATIFRVTLVISR